MDPLLSVDMALLEQVHDEMLTEGKIMVVMLVTTLKNADKEKNAEAIQQGVDFASDMMAHKIAFQYAIRKAAQTLEHEKHSIANGKKTMAGFGIMSQACEVHQNLREALKGFFQQQVDKLRAGGEEDLRRFN